jgi:hypothetical protein
LSFYIASPYKSSPPLMTQGTTQYLFGSLNIDVANTEGIVLSDAATGAVGTVTVKIYKGNIPIPGNLITIVGSGNLTGAFNVTNAVITAVSAAQSPDEGVFSISFALSSSSQGTTLDTGAFIVPIAEVGDTLTAAIVAALPASSAPTTSPASGPNSVGKSLSATVSLPASTTAVPSTLTGVTVVLQGANLDAPSEYNTIATIGTGLAAGTVTQWQSGQGDTATGTLAAGSVDLINFRFYRFQVTAATGAGPIIAKLLQ